MKSKKLIRITGFFTALCLILTQSLEAQLLSLSGASKLTHEILSPETGFIQSFPSHLGKIKESWPPSELSGGLTNSPLIIIQDAHGQYKAQKSIQSILEYFKNETGLSEIYIEGGAGRQEPSLLKYFEDEKTNQKAADLLARYAEIGGPELFLLDSPEISAYGIEAPGIYLHNLNTFQAVISRKSKADAYLKTQIAEIDARISRTANKEFIKFFKDWTRHEEEMMDLSVYLGSLSETALKIKGINLKDAREQIHWPMLVRFFELRTRQARIDSSAVQKEQQALMQWAVKANLDDKLILELKEMPGRPAARSRTFWENFYAAAHSKGFNFQEYPHFFLLEGYRVLESELEAEDLFAEIQQLREVLGKSLAVSDQERQLRQDFENWILTRKLFSLSLSRSEWEQVKNKSSRFFTRSLSGEAGFIRRQAFAFYRLAEKRDEIMIRNWREQADLNHKHPSILVAGGFHTDGLSRILKEQRIPYVVVTPHMAEVENGAHYLNAMKGEKPKASLNNSTLRLLNAMTPLSAWGEGRFSKAVKAIQSRREVLRELLIREFPDARPRTGFISRPEGQSPAHRSEVRSAGFSPLNQGMKNNRKKSFEPLDWVRREVHLYPSDYTVGKIRLTQRLVIAIKNFQNWSNAFLTALYHWLGWNWLKRLHVQVLDKQRGHEPYGFVYQDGEKLAAIKRIADQYNQKVGSLITRLGPDDMISFEDAWAGNERFEKMLGHKKDWDGTTIRSIPQLLLYALLHNMPVNKTTTIAVGGAAGAAKTSITEGIVSKVRSSSVTSSSIDAREIDQLVLVLERLRGDDFLLDYAPFKNREEMLALHRAYQEARKKPEDFDEAQKIIRQFNNKNEYLIEAGYRPYDIETGEPIDLISFKYDIPHLLEILRAAKRDMKKPGVYNLVPRRDDSQIGRYYIRFSKENRIQVLIQTKKKELLAEIGSAGEIIYKERSDSWGKPGFDPNLAGSDLEGFTAIPEEDFRARTEFWKNFKISKVSKGVYHLIAPSEEGRFSNNPEVWRKQAHEKDSYIKLQIDPTVNELEVFYEEEDHRANPYSGELRFVNKPAVLKAGEGLAPVFLRYRLGGRTLMIFDWIQSVRNWFPDKSDAAEPTDLDIYVHTHHLIRLARLLSRAQHEARGDMDTYLMTRIKRLWEEDIGIAQDAAQKPGVIHLNGHNRAELFVLTDLYKKWDQKGNYIRNEILFQPEDFGLVSEPGAGEDLFDPVQAVRQGFEKIRKDTVVREIRRTLQEKGGLEFAATGDKIAHFHAGRYRIKFSISDDKHLVDARIFEPETGVRYELNTGHTKDFQENIAPYAGGYLKDSSIINFSDLGEIRVRWRSFTGEEKDARVSLGNVLVQSERLIYPNLDNRLKDIDEKMKKALDMAKGNLRQRYYQEGLALLEDNIKGDLEAAKWGIVNTAPEESLFRKMPDFRYENHSPQLTGIANLATGEDAHRFYVPENYALLLPKIPASFQEAYKKLLLKLPSKEEFREKYFRLYLDMDPQDPKRPAPEPVPEITNVRIVMNQLNWINPILLNARVRELYRNYFEPVRREGLVIDSGKIRLTPDEEMIAWSLLFQKAIPYPRTKADEIFEKEIVPELIRIADRHIRAEDIRSLIEAVEKKYPKLAASFDGLVIRKWEETAGQLIREEETIRLTPARSEVRSADRQFRVDVRPRQDFTVDILPDDFPVFSKDNPILADRIKGRRVLVVFDGRLGEKMVSQIMNYLKHHIPENHSGIFPVWDMEILRDPEAAAEWVDQIHPRADELKLSRKDVMVIVGGQELMEVAGFAAARYHRGIPVIQIPLDLNIQKLISADTGISENDGLVYPPESVLMDPSLLSITSEDISFEVGRVLSYAYRTFEATPTGYLIKRRPDFSYEVKMTREIFDFENTLLANQIGQRKFMVVLDNGLDPQDKERLNSYFNLYFPADSNQIMAVDGGEAAKTEGVAQKYIRAIHERAQKLDLSGDDVFVVIGGGAVLDVAGFAASRWKHGTPIIRIPTTLLGQIDAGIGVKNGINKSGQKNFDGVFDPPEAVFVDPDLLERLDYRQMVSGLSEAVKVSLMKDAAYFRLIEKGYRDVLAKDFREGHDYVRILFLKIRNNAVVGIFKTIRNFLNGVVAGIQDFTGWKWMRRIHFDWLVGHEGSYALDLMWLSIARHLEQIHTDPFETQLARPLDYGHEWAHRWEKVTDYRASHGEAVGFGTAIDTVISYNRGYISRFELERTLKLLEAIGLPTYDDRFGTPAVAQLWPGLESFRIHLGGKLTISLLARIGRKKDVHEISKNELHNALNYLQLRHEAKQGGSRSEVRNAEAPNPYSDEQAAAIARQIRIIEPDITPELIDMAVTGFFNIDNHEIEQTIQVIQGVLKGYGIPTKARDLIRQPQQIINEWLAFIGKIKAEIDKSAQRSEIRAMKPEEVTDARAVEFYRMNRELNQLFAAYKQAKENNQKQEMESLSRTFETYAETLTLYLGEIRSNDPNEQDFLNAIKDRAPPELKTLSQELAQQIQAFSPQFIEAYQNRNNKELDRLNHQIIPLLKRRLKIQLLRLQYELKNNPFSRQMPIFTLLGSVIRLYHQISYEYMWRERRARGERRIELFRTVDSTGHQVDNLYYEKTPVLRIEADSSGAIKLSQIVWKYVDVEGGPRALQPVLTPISYEGLEEALRSRMHALESQAQDYSQLVFHDQALEDIALILKPFEDRPDQLGSGVRKQVINSLREILKGPDGKGGLKKKLATVSDRTRKTDKLAQAGDSLETAITWIEKGDFKNASQMISSARKWIEGRLDDILKRTKVATERKRDYLYLALRDRATAQAMRNLQQSLKNVPLSSEVLLEQKQELESLYKTYFSFLVRNQDYEYLQRKILSYISAVQNLLNSMGKNHAAVHRTYAIRGLAGNIDETLNRLDQMTQFRRSEIRAEEKGKTPVSLAIVLLTIKSAPGKAMSLDEKDIVSKKQRSTNAGEHLFNIYSAAINQEVPGLTDWASALEKAGIKIPGKEKSKPEKAVSEPKPEAPEALAPSPSNQPKKSRASTDAPRYWTREKILGIVLSAKEAGLGVTGGTLQSQRRREDLPAEKLEMANELFSAYRAVISKGNHPDFKNWGEVLAATGLPEGAQYQGVQVAQELLWDSDETVLEVIREVGAIHPELLAPGKLSKGQFKDEMVNALGGESLYKKITGAYKAVRDRKARKNSKITFKSWPDAILSAGFKIEDVYKRTPPKGRSELRAENEKLINQSAEDLRFPAALLLQSFEDYDIASTVVRRRELGHEELLVIPDWPSGVFSPSIQALRVAKVIKDGGVKYIFGINIYGRRQDVEFSDSSELVIQVADFFERSISWMPRSELRSEPSRQAIRMFEDIRDFIKEFRDRSIWQMEKQEGQDGISTYVFSSEEDFEKYFTLAFLNLGQMQITVSGHEYILGDKGVVEPAKIRASLTEQQSRRLVNMFDEILRLADEKGFVRSEIRIHPVKILLADKPASENTIQSIKQLIGSFAGEAQMLDAIGIGKDKAQLRKIIEEQKPEVVVVRSDTKAFQESDFIKFARTNGVRAVIRMGAGVDNINQKAAAENGISVIRTHGNANSVANLALRFLLAGLIDPSETPASKDIWDDPEWRKVFDVPLDDFKKAEESSRNVGRGEALPEHYARILRDVSAEQARKAFSKLKDQTIGLLGFGAIPQRLAEKLNEIQKLAGVSFSVMATSPGLDRGDADRVKIAERLEILHPGEEEVLKRSNILSIHLPGEAKNYLTPDKIKRADKTNFIINTARQDVIQPEALKIFFERKGLYFADIDLAVKGMPVQEVSGFAAEFPGLFYAMPHIAASTKNAAAGVETNTLPVLEAVLNQLLGRPSASSMELDIVNKIPILEAIKTQSGAVARAETREYAYAVNSEEDWHGFGGWLNDLRQQREIVIHVLEFSGDLVPPIGAVDDLTKAKGVERRAIAFYPNLGTYLEVILRRRFGKKIPLKFTLTAGGAQNRLLVTRSEVRTDEEDAPVTQEDIEEMLFQVRSSVQNLVNPEQEKNLRLAAAGLLELVTKQIADIFYGNRNPENEIVTMNFYRQLAGELAAVYPQLVTIWSEEDADIYKAGSESFAQVQNAVEEALKAFAAALISERKNIRQDALNGLLVLVNGLESAQTLESFLLKMRMQRVLEETLGQVRVRRNAGGLEPGQLLDIRDIEKQIARLMDPARSEVRVNSNSEFNSSTSELIKLAVGEIRGSGKSTEVFLARQELEKRFVRKNNELERPLIAMVFLYQLRLGIKRIEEKETAKGIKVSIRDSGDVREFVSWMERAPENISVLELTIKELAQLRIKDPSKFEDLMDQFPGLDWQTIKSDFIWLAERLRRTTDLGLRGDLSRLVNHMTLPAEDTMLAQKAVLVDQNVHDAKGIFRMSVFNFVRERFNHQQNGAHDKNTMDYINRFYEKISGLPSPEYMAALDQKDPASRGLLISEGLKHLSAMRSALLAYEMHPVSRNVDFWKRTVGQGEQDRAKESFESSRQVVKKLSLDLDKFFDDYFALEKEALSSARSEVRVVAELMTSGILRPEDVREWFQILFRPQVKALPASILNGEPLMETFAAFFQQNGRIILPAQALLALDKQILKKYFDILIRASARAGMNEKEPQVIIAGDSQGLIKNLVLSGFGKEMASNVGNIIRVESQAEELIAGRLSRLPQGLAVSFTVLRGEEPSFKSGIPAFKIQPEEIRKLKEADQFRYLNHLTQFLLSAAHLDRPEMNRWLQQNGLSMGGQRYPQLTFQTLVSDKLAEFTSQALVARAA